MVARTEELRPPENRLAQCLGRLANRTSALTKLQADLSALDSQRADLHQKVQDVNLDVSNLQAQLATLKDLPTSPPSPGEGPMAALAQLLLNSMGAGEAFSAVKTQLESIGVDVEMASPDAAGTWSAAPRPWRPARSAPSTQ